MMDDLKIWESVWFKLSHRFKIDDLNVLNLDCKKYDNRLNGWSRRRAIHCLNLLV